eukprot:GHVN01063403.1.p1 GENE.GHVN01063403.1~~GHVN01063403.1.p1  ORF type:complete len:726 (-),score=80.47 GHVN01063403.1:4049-6226(-)
MAAVDLCGQYNKGSMDGWRQRFKGECELFDRKEYRTVLERIKDIQGVDAEMLRLQCLVGLAEHDKALELARQLLRSDIRNAGLWSLYGRSAGEKGNYDDAERAYLIAYKNKPERQTLYNISGLRCIGEDWDGFIDVQGLLLTERLEGGAAINLVFGLFMKGDMRSSYELLSLFLKIFFDMQGMGVPVEKMRGFVKVRSEYLMFEMMLLSMLGETQLLLSRIETHGKYVLDKVFVEEKVLGGLIAKRLFDEAYSVAVGLIRRNPQNTAYIENAWLCFKEIKGPDISAYFTHICSLEEKALVSLALFCLSMLGFLSSEFKAILVSMADKLFSGRCFSVFSVLSSYLETPRDIMAVLEVLSIDLSTEDPAKKYFVACCMKSAGRYADCVDLCNGIDSLEATLLQAECLTDDKAVTMLENSPLFRVNRRLMVAYADRLVSLGRSTEASELLSPWKEPLHETRETILDYLQLWRYFFRLGACHEEKTQLEKAYAAYKKAVAVFDVFSAKSPLFSNLLLKGSLWTAADSLKRKRPVGLAEYAETVSAMARVARLMPPGERADSKEELRRHLDILDENTLEGGLAVAEVLGLHPQTKPDFLRQARVLYRLFALAGEKPGVHSALCAFILHHKNSEANKRIVTRLMAETVGEDIEAYNKSFMQRNAARPKCIISGMKVFCMLGRLKDRISWACRLICEEGAAALYRTDDVRAIVENAGVSYSSFVELLDEGVA